MTSVRSEIQTQSAKFTIMYLKYIQVTSKTSNSHLSEKKPGNSKHYVQGLMFTVDLNFVTENKKICE